MSRPLTALLLALTALSCVSVPQRTTDELDLGLPETFGAGESEPVTSAAPPMQSFGDAGLDALIGEALQNSRGLRAIAARIEAAEAQARIAGADRLPQASLDLSGSRQRQNFIGLPIPGASGGVLSSTSSRVGLSLGVSWEADLWGRVRAGREAALAERDAVEADVRAARLSLTARVAKTWFAAMEARLQLELAQQTLDSYQASNDAVEARYAAGLRPPIDLRLFRSQIAEARALVAQRQAALETVRRQLEVLVGRYPSGRIRVEGGLPEPPETPPAGVPADLLARRPDLAAAERRLAAADARLVAARASLYPSLRLTGSGGTASSELEDLLDGDFRVWSLLAGIAQPLFQGGRLRASVDVAEAGVRQALETFADGVLAACSEVETALAVESHLAERQRALQVALGESAAARRISEEEYRQGLSDVLVLLESRRRQLLADSLLLGVRRLRLDNRIDLLLALGGSVSPLAPPTAAGTASLPVSEGNPS